MLHSNGLINFCVSMTLVYFSTLLSFFGYTVLMGTESRILSRIVLIRDCMSAFKFLCGCLLCVLTFAGFLTLLCMTD